MKKANERGQALVEFIIILPIFVLLIFGFIDFGKILYIKNELINIIPEVEEMYQDNKTYDEILALVKKNNDENELNIKNEQNDYVTLEIYRNIELITPGLGIVMDNPYKVMTSMVIEYEKE